MGDGRTTKDVLCFTPGPRQFANLMQVLGQAPGVALHDVQPPTVTQGELALRFTVERDLESVLLRLRDGYFNLLIVDLRPVGQERHFAREAEALLTALEKPPDPDLRFPSHRILALLGGRDGFEADQLIARLARRGVGRVVRDHSACVHAGPALHRAFAEHVLDAARQMLGEHAPGRSALCLAGGGTTGIYFELGALKCLDDCLVGRSVNEFDLYFGISAGAVVASYLAVGYTADEFMAALCGEPGGRLPPTSLSVYRFAHLNLRDATLRAARAAGRLLASLATAPLRGQTQVESLMLDYLDILGPPLRADAFGEMMRRSFEAGGATNDFRKLARELYIGATDQDRRTPVLFGEQGWAHVPISTAVQASLSLNPAFAATRIGSRYYEDGGVSRTSNFEQAIGKGAGLLFVLDPLLPYVSREPGEAARRGLFYNVDQNIRTMSFTRYEEVRAAILSAHPGVSAYTFVPNNRLRRMLALNPLDHRPYFALWKGAYLATLQRLRVLRHRLAGDLRGHGFQLDLARAEAVAPRLEAAREPTLADFFPEGKVALRSFPLALRQP